MTQRILNFCRNRRSRFGGHDGIAISLGVGIKISLHNIKDHDGLCNGVTLGHARIEVILISVLDPTNFQFGMLVFYIV